MVPVYRYGLAAVCLCSRQSQAMDANVDRVDIPPSSIDVDHLDFHDMPDLVRVEWT